MALLLTLLGLSLLIVLHELGHFSVARAAGMTVYRFSVGFGPVIWSRRFGQTIWQWAIFPLGGFVHIAGLGDEASEAAEDTAATNHENDVGFKHLSSPTKATGVVRFDDCPLWQRALVVAAGPLANFILAAVLLAILAGSTGVFLPPNDEPIIGEIAENGSAFAAGLLSGDRIVQVENEPVTSWQALVHAIQSHGGQNITLHLLRQQQTLEVQLTPKVVDGKGRLGIGPWQEKLHVSLLEALPTGFALTWQRLAQTATLLSQAFLAPTQNNLQLQGIPGIFQHMMARSHAFAAFVDMLANLSMSLGFMNLLPIPGLDGSRLLLLGVEGIRRKPLPQRFEMVLHTVGMVFLLGLMAWISVKDLIRIFL